MEHTERHRNVTGGPGIAKHATRPSHHRAVPSKVHELKVCCTASSHPRTLADQPTPTALGGPSGAESTSRPAGPGQRSGPALRARSGCIIPHRDRDATAARPPHSAEPHSSTPIQPVGCPGSGGVATAGGAADRPRRAGGGGDDSSHGGQPADQPDLPRPRPHGAGEGSSPTSALRVAEKKTG